MPTQEKGRGRNDRGQSADVTAPKVYSYKSNALDTYGSSA